MRGKTIVVWFSCGAPSAIASLAAIEKYGKDNRVLLVNTPVKEEHRDNIRFKNDISSYARQQIIEAVNPAFPSSSIVEVFDKKRYMSGINGAVCTSLLKKEARYQFEKKVEIDFHILGFTTEEKDRSTRFIESERENTIPLLIDLGFSRTKCFKKLHTLSILPPVTYRQGLDHANCLGCVKATSATYWNFIRRYYTKVFNQRNEQSARIGCKLCKYKGKRLFLHELPPDAKGRELKPIDCSIFCDL